MLISQQDMGIEFTYESLDNGINSRGIKSFVSPVPAPVISI